LRAEQARNIADTVSIDDVPEDHKECGVQGIPWQFRNDFMSNKPPIETETLTDLLLAHCNHILPLLTAAAIPRSDGKKSLQGSVTSYPSKLCTLVTAKIPTAFC
jgi:hypothetical protein